MQTWYLSICRGVRATYWLRYIYNLSLRAKSSYLKWLCFHLYNSWRLEWSHHGNHYMLFPLKRGAKNIFRLKKDYMVAYCVEPDGLINNFLKTKSKVIRQSTLFCHYKTDKDAFSTIILAHPSHRLIRWAYSLGKPLISSARRPSTISLMKSFAVWSELNLTRSESLVGYIWPMHVRQIVAALWLSW